MTAESTAAAVGPLRAAIVLALVAVGTFFLVIGTVGIIRLPTVYNRMHATSKATTLGAGMIALAGTAFYWPEGQGLSALVTVVFLFLTAPTGAHVISRAAHRMGVPFVDGVAWPGGPDRTTEDTAASDDD
jgi:multicomponent Na+:H+ antiporter subunit G